MEAVGRVGVAGRLIRAIDLLDRENRELLREAAQINKALERNRSSTR